MRQAIVTGSITVSWDHAMSPSAIHEFAAIRLFTKLGWNSHNRLIGGATKDGYVFVQLPKE